MASGEEVFMDVPVVRDFGKKFADIGEVLENVAKALDMLANILKATAFIGLVGGMAIVHIIEQVNPYIKQIAEKCQELSGDLAASADAYERGDAMGSTRFH
jgi:hypothetical protein